MRVCARSLQSFAWPTALVGKSSGSHLICVLSTWPFHDRTWRLHAGLRTLCAGLQVLKKEAPDYHTWVRPEDEQWLTQIKKRCKDYKCVPAQCICMRILAVGLPVETAWLRP